jgi:hypothetical protein
MKDGTRRVHIPAKKVNEIRRSQDARANFVVNRFDEVAEGIVESIINDEQFADRGATISITVTPGGKK